MRLRRGRRLGVALALALPCVAAPTLAAPAPGVALEPLSVSPAGDRFLLSPDGGASRRDGFAVKLFESYAYRPLLRVETPNGERDIIDSELYFDVGASYSLMGRAVFALDLPIVPFEGGDATEHAAVGDLRLAARVRLATFRHADLGAETRVFLPTGSSAAFTSDDALRVSELVTLSGRARSFVYSVSAGYLARKRRELYGTEVGPAIPFSAAAGVDIAGRLQLGPEVQGFTVIGHHQGFLTDRTTPLIGLLGVRLRIGSVVLSAGAGPGLSHAPNRAIHTPSITLRV